MSKTNIVRVPDVKIGDLLGLEEDDVNMLVLEIEPIDLRNRWHPGTRKGVDILFLNMKNQKKFSVRYALDAKIIMYRQSTT